MQVREPLCLQTPGPAAGSTPTVSDSRARGERARRTGLKQGGVAQAFVSI